MELNLKARARTLPVVGQGLAAFIAGIQKESGEIPWSKEGKTDPWDHVESAMGLTVAGWYEEARRALLWLASQQDDDGSWPSAYERGHIVDNTRETHFAAYPAVGVYHYYLVTKDVFFVEIMWDSVRRGIDYALSLQTPTGEIYWAKSPTGKVDQKALLTGCCSVYLSLKCALVLAQLMGVTRPDWVCALEKLGEAIRKRPEQFDMSKARFSMDWYYPILSGAVMGREARERLEKQWSRFVVPGWGVRCVCDRPWVTMAETSELVLALTAMDAYPEAETVFSWLLDKRYADGVYWMGVTFPDRVVWPDEKTTWTAAAVLLAYDALTGLTAGRELFRHHHWADTGGERRLAEGYTSLHR
ncbi:MAG: hypothetical protein N2Z74_09250 [Syntrophales bacterium]|nr:hypothetical protein [Syntrophales bacterium]